MARTFLSAFILLVFFAACASVAREDRGRAGSPKLERQVSGTENLIVAIDALDERAAWASGTNGMFLWTEDGGEMWHTGSVAGADSLQFRDVHAVSLDEAYLLSIGPGDASRIYYTTDRGRSWDAQFVNDRADAFFDCFAFWADATGIAFSDATDGAFPIIRTVPVPWSYVPDAPAAQPNEGGFASSGTCVLTLGESTVLIGTGNAERARVLRSEDRGLTWASADVPVYSGDAAGIATLAFRDPARGVALGGDLANPDTITNNVAVTADGGRTWTAGEPTPFPGAVYGSAFAGDTNVLVAVGPGGAASSTDHADSWTHLDSLTHWSVDFGGPSVGWMVGPQGRITRITF